MIFAVMLCTYQYYVLYCMYITFRVTQIDINTVILTMVACAVMLLQALLALSYLTRCAHL